MKKCLRKIVCIFLIQALLAPAFFYAAYSINDTDLSFFVASDIHYRPQSSLGAINEQNRLPGDLLYSHTNTKSMLTYEADAVIDELLARFEASSAQYLLIPGDISEDGFWDEHLAVSQKLREFKERTGKKIFLIPGNHDIRTSNSQNRLNLSDFLEVYADIGYDEALARHNGSASYTADISDNYRLLAIDACIYREDGSAISSDLLLWIEQQVTQANNDGKKLVGMVHHSVLEHFDIQSIGGNLLCLDNNRELASQFADWGIKYFFTGHEHANDISCAVSDNGNKIFDVETGSLITYPNAYREISFSDSAVHISTKYIDSIDISLLPAGYNAAQLNLLKNDFPVYSYGYFRAGIKSFAYEIPGATRELAVKLKFEEGTKEYEALSEIMNTLSKAVRLPLYDTLNTPETDSVEEICAKANTTLQPSEYTNILDVAAVIYAGHYAGDEKLGFDSPEVTLLRQGLDAVLVYAFMNVPLSTANTLFGGLALPEKGFVIIDNIYTQSAKGIYMNNAARLIISEIIEPAANGIVNDLSAPCDLNVSLEAYNNILPIEGPTVAISDLSVFLDTVTKLLGIAVKICTALGVLK